MKQKEAELLIIAARLLDYPSKKSLEYALAWTRQSTIWSKDQERVVNVLSPLQKMNFLELEKLYVDTFDLKAKIGLYLTAHEIGDSPKRGAALVKLQKIINQAGFDRRDGELADYMPMLYELVAVMDETDDAIRLWKRLGNATQIIYNQLPENNPYYPLISLLMTDV